MSAPSVEFRKVCVRFRLPRRKIPTLKEWAIRRITSRMDFEEFSALEDVSFGLEQGSMLGVVGSNGAGKSTLLRIAAGIIPPTAGEVVVRGRVAPIIELGTGFDPELTGRENVFFNGALLGRSRLEMQRRFAEIVDFAELEDFIDAPLRTYSTGMAARLAFAVATAVEADVLLLDEVLSVGDQSFRDKCRGRMESFRRAGTTIVFVTHDLDTLAHWCTEAIWLHEGRVTVHGTPNEVVRRYRKGVVSHPALSWSWRAARPGATATAEPAPSAAGRTLEPCEKGPLASRGEVARMIVAAMYGDAFTPPEAVGVFSDVPRDHRWAAFVEQLYRDRIVRGQEDGTFRPDSPLTSAELAVLVVRARHGSRYEPPEAVGMFADLPAGHWAARHAEQLHREGAIAPDGEGNFRPQELVSRDQVSVLVEREFGS